MTTLNKKLQNILSLIGLGVVKKERLNKLKKDEKLLFNLKMNIEKIFKVNVTKVNIINKKNRTKMTRGKKVKISGFKKAIITLKKGQSIDLTTGI